LVRNVATINRAINDMSEGRWMNVLELAVVRQNTNIDKGYGNFPAAAIGRRLAERRVSARRRRQTIGLVTGLAGHGPEGEQDGMTGEQLLTLLPRSGERLFPQGPLCRLDRGADAGETVRGHRCAHPSPPSSATPAPPPGRSAPPARRSWPPASNKSGLSSLCSSSLGAKAALTITRPSTVRCQVKSATRTEPDPSDMWFSFAGK
jgi:hypothetical protein